MFSTFSPQQLEQLASNALPPLDSQDTSKELKEFFNVSNRYINDLRKNKTELSKLIEMRESLNAFSTYKYPTGFTINPFPKLRQICNDAELNHKLIILTGNLYSELQELKKNQREEAVKKLEKYREDARTFIENAGEKDKPNQQTTYQNVFDVASAFINKNFASNEISSISESKLTSNPGNSVIEPVDVVKFKKVYEDFRKFYDRYIYNKMDPATGLAIREGKCTSQELETLKKLGDAVFFLTRIDGISLKEQEEAYKDYISKYKDIFKEVDLNSIFIQECLSHFNKIKNTFVTNALQTENFKDQQTASLESKIETAAGSLSQQQSGKPDYPNASPALGATAGLGVGAGIALAFTFGAPLSLFAGPFAPVAFAGIAVIGGIVGGIVGYFAPDLTLKAYEEIKNYFSISERNNVVNPEPTSSKKKSQKKENLLEIKKEKATITISTITISKINNQLEAESPKLQNKQKPTIATQDMKQKTSEEESDLHTPTSTFGDAPDTPLVKPKSFSSDDDDDDEDDEDEAPGKKLKYQSKNP